MNLRLGLLASVLAASTGCLPLVAGPNNFLPAGEIGSAGRMIGGSIEMSQPHDLAFSDDGTPMALWFSEDMSLQLPLSKKVALTGQLKWSSLIPFVIPLPIGASGGVRMTLLEQARDGLSLDLAVKLTGMRAENEDPLTYAKIDGWAAGGDLHVPVSWRAFSWFAVTAAPFLRGYYVSATSSQGPQVVGNILGAGVSFSIEFKAGPVAIAPAFAAEWVRGRNGHVVLAPAPGLAMAARW